MEEVVYCIWEILKMTIRLSERSISVGITSDKRLAPKLGSQYLIGYKRLPEFLRHLVGNRFMFSENLIKYR